MRLLSRVMLGMAITACLALGVLALTMRNATQLEASPDGDPIILKGGSLTIQCPKNDDCIPYNAAIKKHEHKDKSLHVQRIIVRDDNGAILFNGSKANFPYGRPTIEVYMK